ncbi:hypothetical protein FAZ97_33330 [Paraburkholderia acidiphila]|uniref:Uncharacterized protein n=1 Tax=Paraburkholderia acidiphila TaxID=2571747 RepID=A0A7Z2GEE2_9BURK|nr:hypothetical protein FAZ97_33330 [Paraburkholderia acidiphila]
MISNSTRTTNLQAQDSAIKRKAAWASLLAITARAWNLVEKQADSPTHSTARHGWPQVFDADGKRVVMHRPQVTVSTSYPGANADVVAQNVATPIEQQVNGADNMMYMNSSSSSTGDMTLCNCATTTTSCRSRRPRSRAAKGRSICSRNALPAASCRRCS